MRLESQMSPDHVFIAHLQPGLCQLYHGVLQGGGEVRADVFRGRVSNEVFCPELQETMFQGEM